MSTNISHLLLTPALDHMTREIEVEIIFGMNNGLSVYEIATRLTSMLVERANR